MTSPKRIATNSAYLLVANVFSRLAALLYVIIIYNFLTTEEEGFYFFAMSVASILSIHFHSGLTFILIREIAVAKERTSELLGDGLVLSGLLFAAVMILSLIVAGIVVYVVKDPPVVGLGIICFAFALGFTYILNTFGAGFKAHEKLIYEAILLIFHGVFSLIVLWFVCKPGSNLGYIFLAIAGIGVVTNSIAWIVGAAILGRPSLRFRGDSLINLIRESWPLGIADVVRTFYLRAGNLALRIFHGYEFISSFGAPYQITEQMKFIPASIRPAIFPAMCRLAEGNRRGFEWTYNFLMRLLVVIALPFSLMIMAGSGLILYVYLGKDTSDEAILALRILSLIIAVSFPSLVIRNIFIALGRQKLDTVISAAALGVNVILMLKLVPPFGVLGAVEAIFIAEAFLFAIGIFFVYRLGFRLDFLGVFIKPVFCSLPLIAAMALTPREGVVGLRFLVYIACIALYAGLVFLTKTLSREDINNLRRVTRGEDPVWSNTIGFK